MNKFVGPNIAGVAVFIKGGEAYNLSPAKGSWPIHNPAFADILRGLPAFKGIVTLSEASGGGVYNEAIYKKTWAALQQSKPAGFILWVMDMRFQDKAKPFIERWDVARTSACSAGHCVRPFPWIHVTTAKDYNSEKSKWLLAGAPGIVEQDPMAPYA